MNDADQEQTEPIAGLTPIQRSLIANLRQRRTILAVCEHYQRSQNEDDAPLLPWLDELIEGLRTELGDLSRLLRLYDLAPAQIYAMHSQVDEGRYQKGRAARLGFLLGRARSAVRWYEQQLAAQPPADAAELWGQLLAAEQLRMQEIETLLA